MTNNEKIEEIVIDVFEGWTKVGFTDEEMIAILSKLADWKDQQYADIIKEESNTSYESGLAEGERKAEARFKEYLEKKTEHFIRTNASPQGTYQEGFDDGYTSAIDEIINELFTENRMSVTHE